MVQAREFSVLAVQPKELDEELDELLRHEELEDEDDRLDELELILDELELDELL
uniref:Uncharacterized protein n=1 Tax=viral metagenome TaxID=1070528 RepID=A0A6M3IVH4_9ZZZZ